MLHLAHVRPLIAAVENHNCSEALLMTCTPDQLCGMGNIISIRHRNKQLIKPPFESLPGSALGCDSKRGLRPTHTHSGGWIEGCQRNPPQKPENTKK